MRFIGVNIPDNKQILISLTYIYGIGLSLAKKILREVNIDFFKKTKDLSPREIDRLKNIIEDKFKIEGELRKDILMNIKRLKEIESWRGYRHQKNLPVRGQTSRRNSRTIRGNVKRTVSSGRRKSPTPT